jgi:hypothetical protein
LNSAAVFQGFLNSTTNDASAISWFEPTFPISFAHFQFGSPTHFPVTQHALFGTAFLPADLFLQAHVQQQVQLLLARFQSASAWATASRPVLGHVKPGRYPTGG